jgi:hypothetical protein
MAMKNPKAVSLHLKGGSVYDASILLDGEPDHGVMVERLELVLDPNDRRPVAVDMRVCVEEICLEDVPVRAVHYVNRQAFVSDGPREAIPWAGHNTQIGEPFPMCYPPSGELVEHSLRTVNAAGEVWLCRRHPDGQWVTVRPAEASDIDAMHASRPEAES